MFSQASVILFTGGGHVFQHALDRHTPVRQPQSDTPRADTPLWADTPTGADIPTGQPPPSVCWDTPPYPVHAGIHPPAATATDGTHPTGMHSCFICNMNRTLPLGNPWAATLKGVFVGNGRTWWRIYMYGNIHPISIIMYILFQLSCISCIIMYGNIHPISIIMYNHISCINLKMHADFRTIR